MMKHSLTMILVAVLIAAFSVPANAAFVYREDFEDDTVAAAVPVIGGTNVGVGYTVTQNTMAIAANPESLGNTSAQVLSAQDTATAPGLRSVIASFAGGSQSIDGMKVQFEFYSSSLGTHTDDGVRVALVGNTTAARDSFLRNDRDTEMRVDTVIQSATNFGADVWQRLSGTFSLVTPGTYNFSWTLTNLEDSQSKSGVQSVGIPTASFTGGLATGVFIEIVEGGDATTIVNNHFAGFIDNISVEVVPEPGVLTSLLAAALVSGAGVRRRRR